MQPIGPKTLVAVFAIAFVLGVAPSAAADDKGCSNATLKGTFAYTITGSTSAPPPFGGPIAGVGKQTADGNGHVSGTQTVSVNGNILRQTYTGTYTVNPDCTGSITLVVDIPPGLVTHSDFVIDDDGNETRAVQADAGSVVTIIARRQFPVGDWRQ
jgi:uncharacterized protein YdeI (BOF family)